MVGPREFYTKKNKSDRGRQMLYDISYMWNLKSKKNDQKKNKTETDSYIQVGSCRGEECRGMVEIGEGD